MNTTPPQPRRRLFCRLEENLPPLVLTERDIEILKLVRSYRFINTAQIHALVGGSQHNVTERLSRLFHHGYIDRPAHQRELRADGYRIMVYALTPKGAQAMTRPTGEPVSVSKHLTEDNRTAKRCYLAHTLMVSQFRACLTVACREYAGLTLKQWRVPERPLARVLIGAERVPIIPDAHFVLEAEDGRLAHFFVEADRGTMSQGRFLSKLQSYWHLRSTTGPDGNPRAFRVLTIAQSKKRMENLLTTAMHADPRHTGSRMFCFTFESEYSLDAPDAVLREIWRNPVDTLPRSILDRPGANRD